MYMETEQLITSPDVRPLRFDSDGFLIDPEMWTRGLARHIAEAEGVGPLGDAHWRVIDYVRARFFRFRSMPPARRICHDVGFERDAVKGLFDGCRKLWRIAGLPHPGEEAKTYMD
jgi:TusE/DsrC/DsvC family sulfur relay protein